MQLAFRFSKSDAEQKSRDRNCEVLEGTGRKGVESEPRIDPPEQTSALRLEREKPVREGVRAILMR
jgi:hypothetical protein